MELFINRISRLEGKGGEETINDDDGNIVSLSQDL